MGRVLLFSFILFFSNCCFAQDSLQWNRSARNCYLPRHTKAQFAGSMGMISLGAGYSIFKNKTDIDFYIGSVPDRYSLDELYVFSLKITQALFRRIHLNPRWSVMPMTAGFYVTYTNGEKFSTTLPNHYPNGYYWWSESIRPNIFIGGSMAHSNKKHSVSFYYEIGTNELKLVSYGLNTDYLTIWDILHAGIGLKVNLFKSSL